LNFSAKRGVIRVWLPRQAIDRIDRRD
jgi:hypothetical protein